MSRTWLIVLLALVALLLVIGVVLWRRRDWRRGSRSTRERHKHRKSHDRSRGSWRAPRSSDLVKSSRTTAKSTGHTRSRDVKISIEEEEDAKLRAKIERTRIRLEKESLAAKAEEAKRHMEETQSQVKASEDPLQMPMSTIMSRALTRMSVTLAGKSPAAASSAARSVTTTGGKSTRGTIVGASPTTSTTAVVPTSKARARSSVRSSASGVDRDCDVYCGCEAPDWGPVLISAGNCDLSYGSCGGSYGSCGPLSSGAGIPSCDPCGSWTWGCTSCGKCPRTAVYTGGVIPIDGDDPTLNPLSRGDGRDINVDGQRRMPIVQQLPNGTFYVFSSTTFTNYLRLLNIAVTTQPTTNIFSWVLHNLRNAYFQPDDTVFNQVKADIEASPDVFGIGTDLVTSYVIWQQQLNLLRDRIAAFAAQSVLTQKIYETFDRLSRQGLDQIKQVLSFSQRFTSLVAQSIGATSHSNIPIEEIDVLVADILELIPNILRSILELTQDNETDCDGLVEPLEPDQLGLLTVWRKIAGGDDIIWNTYTLNAIWSQFLWFQGAEVTSLMLMMEAYHYPTAPNTTAAYAYLTQQTRFIERQEEVYAPAFPTTDVQLWVVIDDPSNDPLPQGMLLTGPGSGCSSCGSSSCDGCCCDTHLISGSPDTSSEIATRQWKGGGIRAGRVRSGWSRPRATSPSSLSDKSTSEGKTESLAVSRATAMQQCCINDVLPYTQTEFGFRCGLVWLTTAPVFEETNLYSYVHAVEVVRDLEVSGLSGWRLPTASEVYQLIATKKLSADPVIRELTDEQYVQNLGLFVKVADRTEQDGLMTRFWTASNSMVQFNPINGQVRFIQVRDGDIASVFAVHPYNRCEAGS